MGLYQSLKCRLGFHRFRRVELFNVGYDIWGKYKCEHCPAWKSALMSKGFNPRGTGT